MSRSQANRPRWLANLAYVSQMLIEQEFPQAVAERATLCRRLHVAADAAGVQAENLSECSPLFPFAC